MKVYIPMHLSLFIQFGQYFDTDNAKDKKILLYLYFPNTSYIYIDRIYLSIFRFRVVGYVDDVVNNDNLSVI